MTIPGPVQHARAADAVIAVIGASGLVGGAILRELRRRSVATIGTYRRHRREGADELDIRDEIAVERFLDKASPTAVVCAAAVANVEWVESNPEAAAESNVLAVERLARKCANRNLRLAFLSSDYIFDGVSGPYKEHDQPNPINVYGSQKLAAEKRIMESAPDALIVRTTGVFGWEQRGKNFVLSTLRALREGREVNVPSDQMGSPTYAPDLARAIIDLILLRESGVFNVAGPRTLSRAAFTEMIASAFALEPMLVRPVLTAALGQCAARPLNGGLLIDKLAAATRVEMRDPVDALKEMEQTEHEWGII